MESFFAVLFRKFQILYSPSQIWHELMEVLSKACITMHKIVVTRSRENYTSNGAGGFSMSSIFEAEISEMDSSTGYIGPSFQPPTVASISESYINM